MVFPETISSPGLKAIIEVAMAEEGVDEVLSAHTQVAIHKVANKDCDGLFVSLHTDKGRREFWLSFKDATTILRSRIDYKGVAIDELNAAEHFDLDTKTPTVAFKD